MSHAQTYSINTRGQDDVFLLPSDFVLELGGSPVSREVSYSVDGSVGAPVVAVFGGISAGRHVASNPTGGRGWWSDFVGPGRSIDTDHFRILSFDFILGTDGPVTSCDQARVLSLLLDHLGIVSLHAVIGSSYGGMVALAFAESFAARTGCAIVINAAHKPSPMSTAWRSIQRKIVRTAQGTPQELEFLKLARQLAMTTYRTVPEFKERFDAPAEIDTEGVAFPVDSYLEACGEKWAGTHGSERFLSLSESIDLHRVNPADVNVPVLLIGCLEDQLIPIDDVRELAATLAGPVELYQFSSLYGHDSFLKNTEELSPVIRRYIGERNDQAA